HTRWPRDWSSDVCFPISNAGIGVRETTKCRTSRFEIAAAVGEAEFPIWVGLLLDRANHRLQVADRRVVDRNDDAQERPAGKYGFPLPREIGPLRFVPGDPAAILKRVECDPIAAGIG